MQHNSYDPNNHKVRRIVDIEEPLHPLPMASLSIVLCQNRDRQKREHLQYAVEPVEKKKVNGGINSCPDDNIPRLKLEFSPVLVKKERAHHGDT